MSLFSAAGQFQPASPFDFEQSLDFIQRFPPMMGEQALATRKLTKTISIQAQPVVFELTSTGTVDAPQLQYQLHSSGPIEPEKQRRIENRIRFFLSLDGEEILRLAERYGDWQGYWAYYLRALAGK